MKKLNRITFRGSKLSLVDHWRVHKIVGSFKAPTILYKIAVPYLLISSAIGLLIGLII